MRVCEREREREKVCERWRQQHVKTWVDARLTSAHTGSSNIRLS